MESEDAGTQVRRTARARKVNPRLFVGDDIDESYMKLVGRITASDYNGKNDKEELPTDHILTGGKPDEFQSALTNDTGSQMTNKSFIKSANLEAGGINIALKTVSLKKVKKNKKNNDNEPRASASIIARYRSSTESEASEDLNEPNAELKRQVNSLEENGQVKRLRIDLDTSSADENSDGAKFRSSASLSLPSIEDTKNVGQQNSCISENSSPMNVSSRTDSTKSPFHGILNPFVSISNKLDPKQPKIVLTSEPKFNLPGKKLKIVALKPITTLKENLTPEGRASPILENAAPKLVLGQDGPLELKIIKKESFPKAISNFPSAVKKSISQSKKETPGKVGDMHNDSSANIFSSDGEDDIPLTKLIQKKAPVKKKKLLQYKELKLQKQKVKKKITEKMHKTNMKKKGKINDQDDLPLKLLLKKSKSLKNKNLSKATLLKSKNLTKASLIKSKSCNKASLIKTQLKKTNDSDLKNLENNFSPEDYQPTKVKKKNKVKLGGKELLNEEQVIMKVKEGKGLKIKPKFRNLDSKVTSVKKNFSLNNKKANKASLKKMNKLRFKFPQKKIKKDVPISNETTNIVISVSGLEGDYACLAIDKDHISSQHEQSASEEISDTAKIKTKRKSDEDVETPIKKYTCNSGLVLEEDISETCTDTKLSSAKDSKANKKVKESSDLKLLSITSLEDLSKNKTSNKESKTFFDKSTPDSPKAKFKIPKDLNRNLDVKPINVENPSLKNSKKDSLEGKDVQKENENNYLVEPIKESKIKDTKKSDKTESISKFDIIKNNKDIKKENIASSTEAKNKLKQDKTVPLDSETKSKEEKKQKGDKEKKLEKEVYEKVKTEKDNKKHRYSNDKKERNSLDFASSMDVSGTKDDKIVKKEKNENKIDLVKSEKEGKLDYGSKNSEKNPKLDQTPKKIDKETKKGNKEVNVDSNPKKIDKENKLDLSSIKKEKEALKDVALSTVSTLKVKKKENFEEALSSIPLIKPHKSKLSLEGTKNQDKKSDKEEKRIKEKRKESKDIKQEISEDILSHGKEKGTESFSKSNKEDTIKVKKEERHKHEKYYSSSKSEDRRRSYDNERSEKDYKRKRDEEKSRHSSHKKHKKDRSESHRHKHLSSEVRKHKHSHKKDKNDSDSSSSYKSYSSSLETEKEKIITKIEDTKDVINQKIIPEKKKYMEDISSGQVECGTWQDKLESSKNENLQVKSKVKSEVIIDEEYLINPNIISLKSENETPHQEDLKVASHLQSTNNSQIDQIVIQHLKNESESLLNQNEEKEEPSKISSNKNDSLAILVQKEIVVKNKTSDIVSSNLSHNKCTDYCKNQENDAISDLGILEELKDLKEKKERTDENAHLLNIQKEENVEDVRTTEDFTINQYEREEQNMDNPVSVNLDKTLKETQPISINISEIQFLHSEHEENKKFNLETNVQDKTLKECIVEHSLETNKEMLNVKNETFLSNSESNSLNKEILEKSESQILEDKISKKSQSTNSKKEKFSSELSELSELQELGSILSSNHLNLEAQTTQEESVKIVPRNESLTENKPNLNESLIERSQKSEELSHKTFTDISKEGNQGYKISKQDNQFSSNSAKKESVKKGLAGIPVNLFDVSMLSSEEFEKMPMPKEIVKRSEKDYKKKKPSTKVGISMKDYIYRSVFQPRGCGKEEAQSPEKLKIEDTDSSTSANPSQITTHSTTKITIPKTATKEKAAEPSYESLCSEILSIPLSSIPLPGEPIPTIHSEIKPLVSSSKEQKREEPENKKLSFAYIEAKIHDEKDEEKYDSLSEVKKQENHESTQIKVCDEAGKMSDNMEPGICQEDSKIPLNNDEIKKIDDCVDTKEMTVSPIAPNQNSIQINLETLTMAMILDEKENTAPMEDFDIAAYQKVPHQIEEVKLIPKELTPEEKEEKERRDKQIVEERLNSYESLDENLYLVDKVRSKRSKEAKRMVCDCFLSKEEISNNEMGCGDECLNRLLLIEW